jgi:hypothetical protein
LKMQWYQIITRIIWSHLAWFQTWGDL